MSIQTTNALAAAALDVILANINNVGFAVGEVLLYTGSRPAHLSIAATGTLLATCGIKYVGAPAFSNTDTTTLVATGNTGLGVFAEDTNPAAAGTMGYWQLNDYNGTPVLRGSVGLAGSGEDIEWNTLTVTAGVLVQVLTMLVQIQNIT